MGGGGVTAGVPTPPPSPAIGGRQKGRIVPSIASDPHPSLTLSLSHPPLTHVLTFALIGTTRRVVASACVHAYVRDLTDDFAMVFRWSLGARAGERES